MGEGKVLFYRIEIMKSRFAATESSRIEAG